MTLTSLISSISGARSAILTGLAVAGLCLPLGFCAGHRTASAKYEAARVLASAKAIEIDAHSKETASAERVQDVLAISKKEEELIDAIQSVPDTAPDRVRVALGCQRLRQAGTSEAALPVVCRPGSRDGAQAPTD